MRRLSIKAIIAGFFLAIGVLLIWKSGFATIKTENVTIRNAGVKLAGTLATPRWNSEPVPGLVVVHGSGRVRREDLRGFVNKLVPHGYAVLIFDKSGVGKSTGVFTNLTVTNSEARVEQLASDVSAAVTFLGEYPGIDAENIGMIGNNQAGWVMPVVAAENDLVSFFVSISGPAVTVGQEDIYSQLTGNDAGPYTDLSPEDIQVRYEGFGGPHGFDPMPRLQDLSLPSLWLLGERDKSVPTQHTVKNLAMLPQSDLFDVTIIENADHNLRDVDSRDRYDYWTDIVDWLAKR